MTQLAASPFHFLLAEHGGNFQNATMGPLEK